MQYEFEKLRVTLVSKDERMRTLFLFLFLFFFFSFFFFWVRLTFTSRNAVFFLVWPKRSYMAGN